MGNGNSKPNGKSSPTFVEQPVNVMITKEVTERWEAIRQQSEEKHRIQTEENFNAPKEKENGESTPNSIKENEMVMIDPAKKGTSPGTADLQSLKNEDDAPVSMQLTQPSPIVGESEEITLNYDDNMGKFGKLFVPRNPSTLPYDLENGNGIQDSFMNCELPYSVFLQQPTEECNRTIYEEVNETADAKKKRVEFIDEEAIIGSNNGITGQSNNYHMKEVRVPKPALPVVLDQDEEGKVTVQTINAWKVRQRLEQEISQNNEHWTGELQRITAKVENETRRQAEDFQRRIDYLKERHGETIEPPYRAGAHCDLLVSQIGNCYQKNETQVLMCSDLVRQFAQCTNKSV